MPPAFLLRPRRWSHWDGQQSRSSRRLELSEAPKTRVQTVHYVVTHLRLESHLLVDKVEFCDRCPLTPVVSSPASLGFFAIRDLIGPTAPLALRAPAVLGAFRLLDRSTPPPLRTGHPLQGMLSLPSQPLLILCTSNQV